MRRDRENMTIKPASFGLHLSGNGESPGIIFGVYSDNF